MPGYALPRVKTGSAFGFLSGVRVVDLTTSVAGPYGTMLLSDFGADVIKVERASGDDARQWGPPFLDGQALWFTAVNRNKKSVVMDLRSDEGRAALMKLVSEADVFVTNQPPDVQRKLKLDYAHMKEAREDLIFVSITGFGLSGPRAELTCYDLIAEGYSGIMDITGAGEGAPQKIGAPAADMLAGQDAAMATMAALMDRQRTGQGHKIDISLVESMTRFLTCRISSYLGSGEVPVRSGGTDSVIAIYQPFDTADLPINLGLGSDAIWARFWSAMGDVEYGQRPEFASNALRRENRAEIVGRIQEILKTRPRADWLEVFASSRIPAGPINRVDEVAGDAELQARGLFFALEDGEGRVVPQIGLGIQIDDAPCIPRGLPPLLGEHNDEILGE
ncbi:CaiB/BaiF CoA transferase family protein [Salipiger abyssi]|uniref:CaiB/BaiF CoA transferase family protein n=1 Tax=Salipiger abyssi TaxID=1250539 RepID=UPI001A901022|nr:CoA transferase [Salipiger abyssi]MBN9889854.1 CoA transferase [Salipiger abyssi]